MKEKFEEQTRVLVEAANSPYSVLSPEMKEWIKEAAKRPVLVTSS